MEDKGATNQKKSKEETLFCTLVVKETFLWKS